MTQEQGIDGVMDKEKLDASSLHRVAGLDDGPRGGDCGVLKARSMAAVAVTEITVTEGTAGGLRRAFSFWPSFRKGHDRVAYAFEQATMVRARRRYLPTYANF